MDKVEQPAVPKFASFKSNVNASAKQGSVDAAKSHHHHYRHRHHHHHHRRRRREASLEEESPPNSSLVSHESSDHGLFIIDHHGDAKNVEYGSLYRYSIPGYRRTGHGGVIGVPPSLRIDREESTEKELTLTFIRQHGRHSTARLLTSKQARGNAQRFRLVTHNPDTPIDSTTSDFIELRSSRKRKRETEDPVDEVAGVDYRSIEGKAKGPDPPIDEDLVLASESDVDDFDENLDLRARQTNALLLKQARADPSNIDSWLALVDHQARLVQNGTEKTQFTSSERRALADLRLSILKEAASHISEGQPGRERLLQITIEAGKVVWNPRTLLAKWMSALTECPTSILLWTDYIDYMQDNQVSFRYEICKDAYVLCLRVLSESYAGANNDQKKGVCGVQVLIFVRLTCFIRDAGYDELAIALWQAVLEFHFFMPNSLRDVTLKTQLSSLEEFWESETARIGEIGASGWARHFEGGATTPRPLQLVAPIGFDRERAMTSFANEEGRLSRKFILPASADDDAAMTDPFRHVMFSDMKEILESVCDGPSQEALVIGLLQYLGLPPISAESLEYSMPQFENDPHLVMPVLHSLERGKADSEQQDVQTSLQATDTLYNHAFQLCRVRMMASEDSQQFIRFLDRCLSALCVVRPADEFLAEYFIAFKLCMLPEEASKAAKRILKQRSSSLRLYNAYALAVAYLDCLETALEVWSAALGMRKSLGMEVQDDVVVLWQSRLLTQVRLKQDAAALSHLLEIPSEGGSTAEESHIRQLQTTRMLEEGFDRMHLLCKPALAVAYANILAWLSYLATDKDVNCALRVYKKYNKRLAGGCNSLALQLLHQSKALLLKAHVAYQRPYKPAILRQDLQDTLVQFPNNSIFLNLYATLVTQDRLRSLMQQEKLSMQPTTVAQWSSKLAEEFIRAERETSGSTSNSIRATFSTALLDPESKVAHSPALWMKWLHFEYRLAKDESESLLPSKQIFLNGLRYLPWYKAWIILGLEYLSDGTLSRSEIRQVYETMNERGLRVRGELESSI